MKFELNLQNRNISDDVLIKDLQRVARELNKKSITRDEYCTHGQYHADTICRRFKTWKNAIEKAGLEKHVHSRIIPEGALLEDLRMVANKLKKQSVTRDEYELYGNHTSKTYESRFKTWNNALEKAGLQKNLERNISDEQLFENLEEVWIRLGRQPKNSEMHHPLSKYSNVTYSTRFGSWNKALEKFIKYVNAGEVRVPPQKIISTVNNIETNEIKELEPKDNSHQSVVKLSTHKTKREISMRLRFIVMKRDNFRCKTCGRSPATDSSVILHVDHIKPYSKGGETIQENLQTLCSKCNIGKSNLQD
jgi:hypothetical protein